MIKNPSSSGGDATDGGALAMLIDEFVADIRRRTRAVECLLKPQRPPWDFDPDALPTEDVRRLLAIKREVEKTFNAIFSDRPRSHAPLGSGSTSERRGRVVSSATV